MKKLLSALFALALCSSMALATVPFPSNCTVTPCDALNGVILCPDTPNIDPDTVVNMTIRNQANNPIANAAVNISFAAGPFCFCTSMIYNTTTDAQGKATLTLRGGGCLNGVTDAAVIRANSVIVRSYPNAKSPDWDGVGGTCKIDLGDAIEFSHHNDFCFDLDNNLTLNLGDSIGFARGYSPAHSCVH